MIDDLSFILFKLHIGKRVLNTTLIIVMTHQERAPDTTGVLWNSPTTSQIDF